MASLSDSLRRARADLDRAIRDAPHRSDVGLIFAARSMLPFVLAAVLGFTAYAAVQPHGSSDRQSEPGRRKRLAQLRQKIHRTADRRLRLSKRTVTACVDMCRQPGVYIVPGHGQDAQPPVPN